MKAVARQYGAALAEAALARKRADKLRQEFADFLELLEQSADLKNFLGSPAIGREAKQALIEKLLKRLGADQTLRNFIFIIVDHHRIPMLGEIRESFESELLLRQGLAKAQVISVRELSAKEKGELVRVLEKVTGKKIEASYEEDAQLLGGAVVRIGSTIYDGSVRGQLNRMMSRLATE